MNIAPESITIDLGEATLTVPVETIVANWLESALPDAQIQKIARDVGGYSINVRARQIWKFEASMLEQFARAILAQANPALITTDAQIIDKIDRPGFAWSNLTQPEQRNLLDSIRAMLAQAPAGVDAVELAAKAIYRMFDGSESHPWMDGGNSNKQDDARRYARAALSAQSAPVDVRPDLSRLVRYGLGVEADSFCRRQDGMFVALADVEALLAHQAPDAQQGADDALNNALQRACTELPEGYEIRITVERDAGWVEWSDSDGETHSIDHDGSLCNDVIEAIDAALAKDGPKP